MGVADDVSRIKNSVDVRVAEKGGSRDEVPRAIRIELDLLWEALERTGEKVDDELSLDRLGPRGSTR